MTRRRHLLTLAPQSECSTLLAMAKFTGIVRKNDLEGGFYELATTSGEVYRLSTHGKAAAGNRVEVEGTIEKGGFGIQMSGPSLKVDSIRVL